MAYPRDHPLHQVERLTPASLKKVDLLLLTEGHCLADQAMELCQRDRDDESLGDLRAASLETLLQFVAAGYGVTLLPALAIQSPWLRESGVICRALEGSRAKRRVRLVFRPSFPRMPALAGVAEVIRARLPNTVTVLGGA